MTPLDRAASVLLFLPLGTWLLSPSAGIPRVSAVALEARAAAAAIGIDAPQQPTREVSVDVGPQPVLFREGPITANRRVMTADTRFRRTERVHLELAVRPGSKADSGRLLDRNGLAVDVSVPVSERTDPVTRQRWIMADLTLTSLPPADYVIELRIADAPDTLRTVAAGIRVVK